MVVEVTTPNIKRTVLLLLLLIEDNVWFIQSATGKVTGWHVHDKYQSIEERHPVSSQQEAHREKQLILNNLGKGRERQQVPSQQAAHQERQLILNNPGRGKGRQQVPSHRTIQGGQQQVPNHKTVQKGIHGFPNHQSLKSERRKPLPSQNRIHKKHQPGTIPRQHLKQYTATVQQMLDKRKNKRSKVRPQNHQQSATNNPTIKISYINKRMGTVLKNRNGRVPNGNETERSVQKTTTVRRQFTGRPPDNTAVKILSVYEISPSHEQLNKKRQYDRAIRRHNTDSIITSGTVRVPLHVLPALAGTKSPDWPTRPPAEENNEVQGVSSHRPAINWDYGQASTPHKPPTTGWTSLTETHPTTKTVAPATTTTTATTTRTTTATNVESLVTKPRPLFTIRPRPPIAWPSPTRPSWSLWPRPTRTTPTTTTTTTTTTVSPLTSALIEIPSTSSVLQKPAAESSSELVCVRRGDNGSSHTIQVDLNTGQYSLTGSGVGRDGRKAPHTLQLQGTLSVNSGGSTQKANQIKIFDANGMNKSQVMSHLENYWVKESRITNSSSTMRTDSSTPAAVKHGAHHGDRIVCVVWRETGEPHLAPLPELVGSKTPTRQPQLSITPESSVAATTTPIPSISQAMGSLSDSIEAAATALADSTSSQLLTTMTAVDHTASVIGSSVKQYIGTSIPSITLVTTIGVPVIVALLALLGAPPLLLSAISVSSPLMLQGLATLYNSLPIIDLQPPGQVQLNRRHLALETALGRLHM